MSPDVLDPEFCKARLSELRKGKYYTLMAKADKKTQAQEWRCLALDLWEQPFRRVAIWDDIAMWAEIAKEVRSCLRLHALPVRSACAIY